MPSTQRGIPAPKIAVYKFSSCDGCQLSILNLEDDLLDFASAVDICFFLEATSTVKPGPYDIGIVEGSISTPHEIERIKEIRKECEFLIALGTCATAGGIQALRNFALANEYAAAVYPHPEYLSFLPTSTAIAEHVQVDLSIWGCPVNKTMVLDIFTSILQGRKPVFPPSPVCIECKRSGIVCVAVAKGIPCLGPVVHGGCGALCPANGRGCYGCFGPSSTANFNSLVDCMVRLDRHADETADLLRGISNHATQFRTAAETAKALAGKWGSK